MGCHCQAVECRRAHSHVAAPHSTKANSWAPAMTATPLVTPHQSCQQSLLNSQCYSEHDKRSPVSAHCAAGLTRAQPSTCLLSLRPAPSGLFEHRQYNCTECAVHQRHRPKRSAAAADPYPWHSNSTVRGANPPVRLTLVQTPSHPLPSDRAVGDLSELLWTSGCFPVHPWQSPTPGLRDTS